MDPGGPARTRRYLQSVLRGFEGLPQLRQLRSPVAHQCRDRRADPVQEKETGNFCEYFEMSGRPFLAKAGNNPREAAARERLKKLFGD